MLNECLYPRQYLFMHLHLIVSTWPLLSYSFIVHLQGAKKTGHLFIFSFSRLCLLRIEMAILIGISLIRSKLFRTVLDLVIFRAKLKIFIRPNFISRLSGPWGQISGLIREFLGSNRHESRHILKCHRCRQLLLSGHCLSSRPQLSIHQRLVSCSQKRTIPLEY